MTVIDSSLDIGQNGAGAPVDGRELAMLRHDIRAALQGLIAAVGHVEPAGLSDEAHEQVERVAAAAKVLTCLAGTLLGDEPGGTTAARHAVVDIERFLRHMRRRHAAEARDRGLSFQVEAEPNLPGGLRVDLISLARIVDNLIGNAVKFTPSGTVRLIVGCAADGAAVLRVVDSGPGLAAPAHVPRQPGAFRSGQGLGLQS